MNERVNDGRVRGKESIVLSFGTIKRNEKIFEIVELPKKDEKNRYFFVKCLHMSEKSSNFASQNCKKTIKLTNMETALRQPVLQGTISEEKWESLHTIEELDSALKNVIHKHFQG